MDINEVENLLKWGSSRFTHAGAISRTPKKDIFLLETHIAGTSHIAGIDELAAGLNKGEKLIMLREPGNRYDENAILVKNRNLAKLGYVPMRDNLIFARLMDAGKSLYCRVSDLADINGWIKIEIEIYLQD